MIICKKQINIFAKYFKNRDQNEYKNWYIKMLIKTYLLRYEQLMVKWSEIYIKGDDDDKDRIVLFYLKSCS